MKQYNKDEFNDPEKYTRIVSPSEIIKYIWLKAVPLASFAYSILIQYPRMGSAMES